MKILYVLDSLGTGGAERSTADLWYYLRSRGIEPTIIVLGNRKEGIEKEILQQGFEVFFLKGHGFASQCFQLARLIKENKPDIVHSILFKSNLRVRLSRLKTKFIHVESLVNCTYDRVRLKDPRISSLSFYYYKYLDHFTAGLTDKFLAITETVKTHYVSELNIPEKKIDVLYRGRAENPFLHERDALRIAYRRELGLAEDTLLVLHVGRQEFQKGHLVLLQAIRLIEKNINRPVAFVFLGRKGNSSADISAFLKANPLQSKLYWLDHRYDVAQWMISSDIFVFPSLYEGLGGSLIEAQAASLPIICSNIPVLNEVVTRDKNALMFDVGNGAQLGECLINFINNREKRSRFGESSLSNFRSRFLLQRINEKTLEYYKQL
jgi:glycosyltransferase involved in cell wall biosynthesis